MIRVGTSSWADPGFIKDWYPPQLPVAQRLGYYARHFDYVELNSSFYAVPERRMVERWARSTPEGFVFDMKLHKSLSRHAFREADLPKELRPLARTARSKATLTPELEAATAAEFLRAVEPLVETGKFGAFLLQLSPAFSPQKHSLAELDALLEALSPRTVAVELRNRNWLREEKAMTDFFASRKATLVGVDGPRTEHFTVMPPSDWVTNDGLAYLRLHGRNAEGFISGKTVAERFDYEYSEAELEETAARAKGLAEQAREVHVAFNNNHSDYAPRAAERLRQMLGQIPFHESHRRLSAEQTDLRF